jgi:hypothetical protein
MAGLWRYIRAGAKGTVDMDPALWREVISQLGDRLEIIELTGIHFSSVTPASSWLAMLQQPGHECAEIDSLSVDPKFDCCSPSKPWRPQRLNCFRMEFGTGDYTD